MTKNDERLIAFLRGADPAGTVDDLRAMAVQERLFQALNRTPQDKRPPMRIPFGFLSAPLAVASRSAMAGLAVLMLGLFVGRTLETGNAAATTQTAARQAMVQAIAQQAAHKTKTGESFSVLAMTEPWQDWMEEGD